MAHCVYGVSTAQGHPAVVGAGAGRLLVGATVTVAVSGFAAADAGAAKFPFEPIKVKRINLPDKITEATRPLFTTDGEHLLFRFDDELWITTSRARRQSVCPAGSRTARGLRARTWRRHFPTASGCSSAATSSLDRRDGRARVQPQRHQVQERADFAGRLLSAVARDHPAGGAVSVQQTNLFGASTAKLPRTANTSASPTFAPTAS